MPRFKYFLEMEDLSTNVYNWEDPNPSPILEEHNGFVVVRDDLLEGGSKIRFADYLISSQPEIKEWVYGSSPATGYAQISLACLCKKYGKKAVIFMADRAWDRLHDYQVEAMRQGADMRFVPNGMLSVTEKRARDYVENDRKHRCLLPIGFDDPTVLDSICVVAQSLDCNPDEVWTVGSSGTLTRGLQRAWPDAEFHCVTVGHKGDYGRAITYKCEIPFNKETKVKPPFPSAPTYDAKAWEFMKEHASPGALFWNVGA